MELRGDVHLRWADLPLNVIGSMLSPSRGALIYYPILIMVTFGALTAWRAATAWERAALIAGAGVLLIQLALNEYSGGEGFFGPRLLIEPLALATPFMARVVWEFGRRYGTRSIIWMAGVGIVAHGAGGFATHLRDGY